MRSAALVYNHCLFLCDRNLSERLRCGTKSDTQSYIDMSARQFEPIPLRVRALCCFTFNSVAAAVAADNNSFNTKQRILD